MKIWKFASVESDVHSDMNMSRLDGDKVHFRWFISVHLCHCRMSEQSRKWEFPGTAVPSRKPWFPPRFPTHAETQRLPPQDRSCIVQQPRSSAQVCSTKTCQLSRRSYCNLFGITKLDLLFLIVLLKWCWQVFVFLFFDSGGPLFWRVPALGTFLIHLWVFRLPSSHSPNQTAKNLLK